MTFGKPDNRQYPYIIIPNIKKTLTGTIMRSILSWTELMRKFSILQRIIKRNEKVTVNHLIHYLFIIIK
jgi:hypothetical protein